MSRPVRALFWLFCCLVLALRVSGMHMHLDDGHETPTMHIADVGMDHAFHHAHDHDANPGQGQGHGEDHDAAHHSVDIGLENQALGKKANPDAGIALIAAVLLCLLLAPRELRLAVRRHCLPRITCPPHLRPPLRGPPANA